MRGSLGSLDSQDSLDLLDLSWAQSLRRPSILAELAWKRWQTGEVDDAASLAPIYLHVTVPNAA